MIGRTLLERSAAQEIAAARAELARGGATSLLALAETHVANGRELDAEAALFVLHEDTNEPLDLRRLVRLAATPVRFTRRVRALDLMARIAAAHPSLRATITDYVTPFVAGDEHRWVQVAAFAVLATSDPPLAKRHMFERFRRSETGDAVLVRARLASVAARAGLDDVAIVAANDRSELVRQCACAEISGAHRLAEIARFDASPRVRAIAIRRVAAVAPAEAGLAALDRIERDPACLVVRVALDVLVDLVEKRGYAPEGTFDRLARASLRGELDGITRRKLERAAARIEVATTPEMAKLRKLAHAALDQAPVGGGARIVVRGADRDTVARAMTTLAENDFGLSASFDGDALTMYRGERRRTVAWRLWHELLHPSPSKRQGHAHAAGWSPRGALRAPPAGLAELTPTRTPGERVFSRERGDWGVPVPRPFDVIGGAEREVRLVSATGTTVIERAGSAWTRLRGWLSVSINAGKLSELRQRSIEATEPAVARAYTKALERATGARIRFEPRTFGPRAVQFPTPRELSAPAMMFAPLAASLNESGFWGMVTSPAGNRISHVALCAGALLVWAVARNYVQDARVAKARAAIPLVIGGWGTRGKSGTERLKGALLQGMGIPTLVKTTGCEAMFIHALPDVRAREVFLYRAYDKASIWEQRDVLELASRLRVKALAWECMALQPDLVELLQRQWMRDDFTTITNAYPDHEDVQGPSGYDVAEVISSFVPDGGKVLTAEGQMLPILRERARERASELVAVTDDEGELIAEELLARFPYHEHPSNLALVARLAEALGVPAVVALAEMADNVVPDLGVLHTYPEVEHAGRRVAFINGMSANERMGALSNWRRMKLDVHDPDADPARFVVTVVNNRADRLARSAVFARLVVEDVAAHRHVLIGTNVSGLRRLIEDALDRHIDAILPTRDLDGPDDQRRRTVATRTRAALSRLHIRRLDDVAVAASLSALGIVTPSSLTALLTPKDAYESYPSAKDEVCSAVQSLALDLDDETSAWVVELLATRRAARALALAVDSPRFDAAAYARAFRAFYRAVFLERVVALDDPNLSGDQVIDAVTRTTPPRARVTLVGLQNIKGTGLDFVYRWVGVEEIERVVARVHAAKNIIERAAALRELAQRTDMGAVEARHATARLADVALPSDVSAFLRARAGTSTLARAKATRRSAIVGALRAMFGRTFDFADSILRRMKANALLDGLARGTITHAELAVEMRNVHARQYGEWAR